MAKKKIFNRKVITTIVLGVAGVAAALGYMLSEEQTQSIINVLVWIAGWF